MSFQSTSQTNLTVEKRSKDLAFDHDKNSSSQSLYKKTKKGPTLIWNVMQILEREQGEIVQSLLEHLNCEVTKEELRLNLDVVEKPSYGGGLYQMD